MQKNYFLGIVLLLSVGFIDAGSREKVPANKRMNAEIAISRAVSKFQAQKRAQRRDDKNRRLNNEVDWSVRK